MQQPLHKSAHPLRSFCTRFRARIQSVTLQLALVLLAVNIFCSMFMVGEKVGSHSKHISDKLNQITSETQPVIQNWLNTTEDSLYIRQLWLKETPNSWEEQETSLLLFRNSKMVYWSNYNLPNRTNRLGLKSNGTIREIDANQVITQYYNKGNHRALVVINLYNSETERYNETIFPEQSITLLPLSDSLYARTVNAVLISAANNSFYLETKPIQSMPWWGAISGWSAVLLLCIGMKIFIRGHTTRHNVFKNAGILMLSLILIRLILYYTGIPNANGVLFDNIFGQHNVVVISLGDMLLSYGMALIYIIYLFQVRAKLKWRYSRLPIGLRILTITFYYVILAFLISTFHYILIKSIHEPKINTLVYNIFELTYTTVVFYTLVIMFVCTLILISRILFTLISTRYIWLRIGFISILIILFLLPFKSTINETGYILLFFVALAAIADYLRARYSKYHSFAISLIVFSAYISTVTTMENRAAQTNNQILYARYLATSQQDRDIVRHDQANVNRKNIDLRFQDLTHARVTENQIIFKHDNNINYKDLNTGLIYGRDTTLYRDGYSHLAYNYYGDDGENNLVIISRRETTHLNTISLFTYTYIILFLLCGLILELVGYNFNVQRLNTRMTLKIQAVVIGVVIITMITVTMVIVSHTLNNFRNEKRRFIHNNSQHLQLSLERFFEVNTIDKLSVNRWIENEEHDAEYSINIFAVDGSLISTSDKDAIITRMNNKVYRDMHYLNNLFFINDINLSEHTSAYAPIIKQGQLLGYLNLQDHSSSVSDSRIQYELLADIINLFFIILCIAIILSDFLYRLLSKPFNQLREAMRNISKIQKIDAVGSSRKISYEVGLLVEQYNLMIDDLAESYSQLARSEREGAWRELAQQVAHEIKNPLTPMRLKIQMLQHTMKKGWHKENLRPKVEETMTLLLDQIDRLAKITREFSDFAKVSEGNPTRMNIIPLIYHVAKLYCDFENIGIRLRLNINNQMEEHIICSKTNCMIKEPADSDPIWINADSDQLTRVFVNICQNAVQAMANIDNSWLEIGLRLESDSVWISFHDNGPGIPEGIHDKLFMPKFTTKSDGSGLGLPISQRIVTSIGGHLSFESTIGDGSTFIVGLPLYGNTASIDGVMEPLNKL